MLNVEDYSSWVIPVLRRNTEWKVFIDALLGEIVTLQKYNMGSYNAVGMNGVEEDIDFSTANDWEICSVFNAKKGIYTATNQGWAIASDEAGFVGDIAVDSYMIMNYAFVLEEQYRVIFTIYDIVPNTGAVLKVGIGEWDAEIDLDVSTDDPLEVELVLEAKDYYLAFGVEIAANSADFKIKDLRVEGVLDEDDEDVRWLVMNRIVSVDNASRYILEKMRDSLAFPEIANMPEELLRQFVKDHNIFISNKGNQLASIMFFYFLGYAVNFVYLYAHKDDYESNIYSYLAQKEDDLLVSVAPGSIYGQVDITSLAAYMIVLKEGHQVVEGDQISNQDNPFPNTFVKVIRVDGLNVYLEEQVSVYADDLLDIYRVYTYAVNPDPTNYFKTSHVDVFFRRNYLEGVDINFNSLAEFFERYLPINVVIRFFGYDSSIPDEVFSIREGLFSVGFEEDVEIVFDEVPTYPVSSYAYAVVKPTPVTHIDIYGSPCDGYSYGILGYDPVDGEPIYTVIEV